MTEFEFRRRPTGDRHGDDLRARLELVDEALLAIAGNVANGRVPGDEAERDRCRREAEGIVADSRRVVDLLAKPPGVIAPDAAFEAALAAYREAYQERRRAADREQGEQP